MHASMYSAEKSDGTCACACGSQDRRETPGCLVVVRTSVCVPPPFLCAHPRVPCPRPPALAPLSLLSAQNAVERGRRARGLERKEEGRWNRSRGKGGHATCGK